MYYKGEVIPSLNYVIKNCHEVIGGKWKYTSTVLHLREWSSSRPCRFTTRLEPRYSLVRMLDWAPDRSECRGEVKNPFPKPGIEPRPSTY
jgi:hypothetical protein